jgi:hypothetical protein
MGDGYVTLPCLIGDRGRGNEKGPLPLLVSAIVQLVFGSDQITDRCGGDDAAHRVDRPATNGRPLRLRCFDAFPKSDRELTVARFPGSFLILCGETMTVGNVMIISTGVRAESSSRTSAMGHFENKKPCRARVPHSSLAPLAADMRPECVSLKPSLS